MNRVRGLIKVLDQARILAGPWAMQNRTPRAGQA
ncbi:hypothetical protein ACUXG4_002449 [Cupriavidus metallidurans]|jgi:hypothetical protein